MPQQHARDLSDVESAAATLELKHGIQQRWAVDSSDYQTAVVQRKCFHVHRLHRKVVADVDWLRWAHLTVSRNPRQYRGSSTQLRKKAQDGRDRLRQTIQQLQNWHLVPGNIGEVLYDPVALKIEDLQQPDWKAPKTVSGHFVSAQSRALQHVQQLKTRCDEGYRSFVMKLRIWWNSMPNKSHI